jgi:hypothetical protein
MKQQTAVDYLLNYCERENWSIPVEVKRYAKAMEKEQIVNAYTSNSMIRTKSKAEQYYNETFNTKEK